MIVGLAHRTTGSRYKGIGYNKPKSLNPGDQLQELVEDRDYYKDLMLKKDKHCIYCGDFYQCRDHIVPVSWTGLPRNYTPGDVVPSCKECNSFLGDRPIFNIPGRAQHFIDVYLTKRLRFFKFPKWSDSEIADLGYNIRISVKRKRYLQKVYESKISNLNLVANGGEACAL